MYKQVCISIRDLIVIGTAIIVILFVCCWLIRQKNKRLSALHMQLETLETTHHKELFKVSLKTQEEERTRIGQNLHDDLGSILATLKLTIDMPAYEQLSSASFYLLKNTCKNLIDKIVTGVRNISHNLLPASLESYGLFAAVEDMAEAISNTGNLKIFLENEAGPAIRQLPNDTALSLYRVLEELLTNTIKHAHAQKVFISFLVRDGNLLISYRDDGKGIDPARPTGMGTLNIQKRLALLNASNTITSSAGQGFLINISLNIV